jgi:BirA family biotin operon repressor/biotin-[acetyl-CoA-carboxylase] ligase
VNDVTQIASWPDRIEALIEKIGPPLTTPRVLAECGSTQDQARALGLGAVVVAGRQTAGRGQQGNRWADTGCDGLAVSVVLEATTKPERSRAVASAIAVALGELLPRRLRVKAPNDVMLDGRKLAGVLIEQADGLAVIGVGINVGQERFEGELAQTAVSLMQAGVSRDRMDILELVLPVIVDAWKGD